MVRAALLVRPALLRRAFGVHGLNDLFPRPKPTRQTGSHCRRDAQRLVNADPVVPNGVDGDHVRVVLELLREAVC